MVRRAATGRSRPLSPASNRAGRAFAGRGALPATRASDAYARTAAALTRRDAAQEIQNEPSAPDSQISGVGLDGACHSARPPRNEPIALRTLPAACSTRLGKMEFVRYASVP